MDDQEFRLHSDEALRKLYQALAAASDSHDFEADFGAALTIEFEKPPAKFVVSLNSPVRQIWLSAQLKSYKFDWNGERGEFVLPGTGQTLAEVVTAVVSSQLGENISL